MAPDFHYQGVPDDAIAAQTAYIASLVVLFAVGCWFGHSRGSREAYSVATIVAVQLIVACRVDGQLIDTPSLFILFALSQYTLAHR